MLNNFADLHGGTIRTYVLPAGRTTSVTARVAGVSRRESGSVSQALEAYRAFASGSFSTNGSSGN